MDSVDSVAWKEDKMLVVHPDWKFEEKFLTYNLATYIKLGDRHVSVFFIIPF